MAIAPAAAAPPPRPFDLADLARRYRLSGGYIRNAAQARRLPRCRGADAAYADHLERAIRAELREIGKIAERGTLE